MSTKIASNQVEGLVVSATDYGAVGGGIVDDAVAIQAALDANGAAVVNLPDGKTYKVGTGLSVPVGVVLTGEGSTLTTSDTISLITLEGSGSGVKGLTLTGPSSSYVAGQKAITATGTRNGAAVAPTYLENILIEDVKIDSFGNYGVELSYCTGRIKDVKITNCGYVGILGYSCKDLYVTNPHIDTIVGETTSGQLNAYGITFTGLTSATDLVRDPASTNCTVTGGYVANIPDWHGLDTHGGVKVKFTGNTVKDCRRGIILTSRGSANGPEDCTVDNNFIGNSLSGDNAVGSEKTAAAIWDIGHVSAKGKRNKITNNKIYQHGGITTNIPATYLENTEGGCVKGNLFSEPYTTAIKLFSGVSDYDISGNTIIDPKGPGTGAGGATDFPQCINITDATNTNITVGGNTLARKDSSVDTVVGELGIVIANVPSKTVHLRSNSISGIVTPTSFGADQSGITGDLTEDFTGTLTGCTTSPTGTIEYTVEGDVVTLHIPDITATSNTNACTITGMPTAATPSATRFCVGRVTDNGTIAYGSVTVNSSGVISLFVGASLGVFTTSGTKGVRRSTITYKL